MSKIYFISGLGADWRMFQFLKLPEHLPQQQINWIEPLSVDEPLQAYVHRLKEQITEAAPILVGLSFGGVVAIELNKILKPQATIIISSLATHHDLPWYYRLLGKTRLQKWLPFGLMKSVHPLAPLFFGAHTRPERKLLKQVILEIDEKFLRWSLSRLLDWKQEQPIPGLIQIHGTSDIVLPCCPRPDMIIIPKGEHLMVMHRADEISAILSKILEQQWTKADISPEPQTARK
ncbi:alpha/beta hydrolase [Pontibacter burrus]|uniref:Alpha/beta hydrolase n=1 Tax=Pontibacter burrus TaxID=2704466 RepID=A0A6B3LMJ5_9BACT|nr:alpha/beta hydrolase [Pontibacter burrus]NEM98142.1 alpha/beta hydrolase [Pontibacter burrus]